MLQNQIGNNTTASHPFVTPSGVVYFRGTDNKLWKVNSDGTAQMQIGNNTTKSTPFVTPDGWVWFQGTDNKLWKVFNNGTQQSQPRGNTTSSSPTVVGDYVYFQGTDNKLWRMKTDGSAQNVINNNTTRSTPFVTPDGWVWFQGTDNKLWKVFNDGSHQSQPGNNTTSSSPMVMGNYVYFRGTDNKLWRMTTDGAHQNVINNNTTEDTPWVTPEGWVWFRGTDNKLWRVFTDGTQQSQPNNNTTLSMPMIGSMGISQGTVGEWTYFQGTDDKLWRLFLPANAIATGTLRPKYYILSVLYSPPGANGGKSGSAVDYASGSSTGSSTSTTSSFKAGLNVEASHEFDIGIVKLGATTQFNANVTTTDVSSENITKSQTFDIKVPGPGADGINHDHDMFMLMLNPLVGVAVYPGNNVFWTMGVDGPVMNIQSVYVGWLKNPSTMAAGVKQQLDAAGLTPADYTAILATNPFAQGATAIDPNRFLPTPQTFPYEPPFSAADPVFTSSITTQNVVNVTSMHTVQHQYSVTATASATLAGIGLKASGNLEWTNSSAYGTSSTSTQSASATVGGPAFGYTGSTDVLVYWDTLYSSFLFAFPSTPPAAVGSITDAAGKPLAFQPITLTVGGRKFQTFTNHQGQYRFYGPTGASGTLAVEGQTFTVAVGAGKANPPLKLK